LLTLLLLLQVAMLMLLVMAGHNGAHVAASGCGGSSCSSSQAPLHAGGTRCRRLRWAACQQPSSGARHCAELPEFAE
jgi:hypothetical protein